MLSYGLAFLGSGAVVVLAGIALARYADEIAEATGLGRLWVGAMLLAAATSLPELTTDVAAVRLGAADLAVGDLFGSGLANMLILALIDLLPPRGRVLQNAAFDHALSVGLAIGLTSLAALMVAMASPLALLGVAPGSVILLIVYLAGSRVVYLHSRRDQAGAVAEGMGARAHGALRPAAIRFALASLVVLVAAPAFAWAARGIAQVTGLGNTFVGTWLVGISTSLPELVASLAAARMGAYDMAVGNLFGSNAFNMAIFFGIDLAQPGSIFAGLDPSHVLSALLAVLLMSLGLAAIVYRARRSFAMLEPDSVLMLLVYVIGMWLLYENAARV
jgi:cation:H+ antiporter